MIWRIALFLGGLTFIQTGYSVLTDPSCQRVSISGFRFFTTSCTTEGQGLPTVFIGVLAIFLGFGISFGNAAYAYHVWAESKITQHIDPTQYSQEDLEKSVAERKSQIQSNIELFGCGTTLILILILLAGTFIVREVKVSHYKSIMNKISVCNNALTAETDFNKKFNAAGAANDRQTQIDELNKIAAEYSGYSAETNNNTLRDILTRDANAYSLIATSAIKNDSATIKQAEAILNADSNAFATACLSK